jgi:hypothetical protein
MAGNALASLAAKMGTRASDAVGAARGSMFGVAQEAVKGQYAAEAQERAHGHSKKILKKLNKKAADGSVIKASISGKGDTAFEYTKGPSNKASRTAQGFRQDNPDHVGNAKTALGQTLVVPESAFKFRDESRQPAREMQPETRPMAALEGPRRALGAPKKEPMAGSQVDQNHQDSTRHFVADNKGGTRSVDRRDSSFAANLDANEAKYLAERKSRLSSIQQAGLGMRPGGTAVNPENKMGEIVGNANKKFDDVQKRMDQKFDNLRNKTNVRIDNAAGARDSVPASYRNKPKGRPTPTSKPDEIF